jgi:DNA-binding MarR family transcriptional regulator
MTLAGLLGRTRAAVLALAVTPRMTTELARELGISAASASVHARALRAVGLLVTERAGKAVLHSATPLGERLLAEATHPPRRRAAANGHRLEQSRWPDRPR